MEASELFYAGKTILDFTHDFIYYFMNLTSEMVEFIIEKLTHEISPTN